MPNVALTIDPRVIEHLLYNEAKPGAIAFEGIVAGVSFGTAKISI